jgi:hypothetical protein
MPEPIVTMSPISSVMATLKSLISVATAEPDTRLIVWNCSSLICQSR